MPKLKVVSFIALLAVLAGGPPGAAGAATAHNTQAAGAYAHTKNNCAPVTGHPDDGGCLPSAIEDYVDGPPGPVYKRDRYRPVPPPPGWPQ